MLRKSLAVVGIVSAMVLASPAGALSVYGELLTSDAAHLLPDDIRARAYLDVELNPLELDWSAKIVGAGLGSGAVPPSLTYTHYFAPGNAGAKLDSAALFIGVRDDFDFELERAIVELDGDFWRQGQATLNLFGGEVTGLLDDNALTVSISSAAIDSWHGGQYIGDFRVVSSVFVAKYSPGVPVPEPGAALFFGVGALLIGRRLHHR